jgi:hypothetical protein
MPQRIEREVHLADQHAEKEAANQQPGGTPFSLSPGRGEKTAGDGEQQQFLCRFGQRGFMNEVMQPVHIDKHQADQCRHEGGGKRECADFPQ